mgnify:CR=1 FL=1
MGSLVSKVWKKLIDKEETKILMLGLDAVGKTTILYGMTLGQVINTIPTIGFNVEKLKYKNLEFTVWDLGWSEKLRHIKQEFYKNTKGLIFVVDSEDRLRIETAKEELEEVLQELIGVPVLVLANKQDLPSPMPPSEVTEKLGLYYIKNRVWNVRACCAVTGEGLCEGFDWLVNAVRANKKQVI